MQLRFMLCAAASLPALMLAMAAQAQTAAAADASLDEVVVTALPLDRFGRDATSNVTVLSGDALVTRRQATLGETLSGIPGVNSDTFGGGASRPVIRGQTAPRVTVLSNGAALMDASQVSPDHAVTTEPMLIDRIEILRGPSALLYGGGAIGGAVNLVDKKVPTYVPVGGGEGVVEVRGGTADDEGAGVVGLTAGQGGFAVRVEAAARRASDYRVPDWSETRLDGSFSRSRMASIGASWVGSRGYLGVAYSELNSTYGLPGHTHEYESCHPHGSSLHCGGHDSDAHDHDHGEEGHDHGAPPFVDLRSRRVDLRGELRNPFAGVERIRLRAGYTDYAHDEIDESVVGTTFENDGYDSRIEVQHAPIGGLRGVIGGQLSRSQFVARGSEAFIPKSVTQNAAIFLLEEFSVGAFRFEGALRHEWQDARALGRVDTNHKPFSASAAGVWSFTPGYALSVSVSRSQRAPSSQELYARGVHLATNTYEIGTATLKKETSTSAELTLRKTAGPTTFSGSVYRYDYDGYVFANTLDRFEDFRLIRYAQADAVFSGVEGEARHQIAPGVGLGVFGDYVRARLKDNRGDLPRIPAGRLGARADLKRGGWSADVEYYRVFKQSRAAAFETATPGYDMVNATLAYDLRLGGVGGQVFVRATNLLNELALNHASFIANAAPLRGRNLTLGLRATL